MITEEVESKKKGFNMHNHLKPIATILIIEDNPELLELEEYHLNKEGYQVLGFTSTKNVEMTLKQDLKVDLMIVDRKLPGIEGTEFIRYLRDKGIQIPVIFVSAKSKESEVSEGFASGGDDYLRKPFNVSELLHRVKAILKRTNTLQDERLMHRDIVLDINDRKTYIDGQEVALTKLEFDLLSFFIQHKNRILERNHLLKHIWNDGALKQKRTVTVTINRLKKKIDPDDSKHYINPVHGIGYKLG